MGEIDVIESLYKHLTKAGETGHIDTYMAVLAPNGEIHPPGSPPVRGKPVVRAWLQRLFAAFCIKEMKLTMIRCESSNRLAMFIYTGTGFHVPVGGGESVPFEQKYVDNWLKQPDGSWRIVLHSWNSCRPGPSIWDTLK